MQKHLFLSAALTICALTSAQAARPSTDETDRRAPFNYGYGINIQVPDATRSLWARAVDALTGRRMTPAETARALAAMPPQEFAPPARGPEDAGAAGMFGSVLPWPIIPLHMALLPDGRVLTYGTDTTGQQGAILWYDVWDPTASYATSQTVLPNTTSTDLFCSGMSLRPDGSFLMTGGDLTINGKRNYSNQQATVFTPATNTIANDGQMNYPRWYPSNVPLPSGDELVVGGRLAPDQPTTIPEYYSASTNTFTPMPGSTLTTQDGWFYPKVFLTSAGNLDLVAQSGHLSMLGYTGIGSHAVLKPTIQRGLDDLPAVMYSPSQVLTIRGADSEGASGNTYAFDNIDFRGATPVVTHLPDVPGPGREWANMTVLADGTVLINGGSAPANTMTDVAYTAYLYNPTTASFTQAATAAIPRLYHSAALLLPDGTVLTGGGGAPGPVNQLNAEIYYPPYLFLQDGSGNFAPRPVVAAAPSTVTVGGSFDLTMGDSTPITAVNMVRVGAVTHSTSLQTRFIPVAFTQNGTDITITAPSNVNDLLPGFWMVFVFNNLGVPAIAPIVDVPVP